MLANIVKTKMMVHDDAVVELQDVKSSSEEPQKSSSSESVVQPAETPASTSTAAVASTSSDKHDASSTEKPKGPVTLRSRITCKLITDILVPFICLLLIIIANSEREAITPAVNIGPGCASSNFLTCFDAGLNNQSANIFNEGILLNTSFYAESDQLKFVCKNQTAAISTAATKYHTVNRGWRTVLAIIPFVLIFWGIVSLKQSSKTVAPAVVVITALLGLNFFRNAKYFAANNDAIDTASGKVLLIIVDRLFWTLFEYALNVFTAFFLLRVLQLWGVVQSIRREFDRLAPTPNRKLLLVGYCFALAIGVVAPGGSNFVIAASILISMNVRKLDNGPEKDEVNNKIAALALFGNALSSAFNLLGVCISTMAEDLASLDPAVIAGTKSLADAADEGEIEIGRLFATMAFPFFTFAPVVMAWFFSDKNSIKEVWVEVKPDLVVLLLTGLVYAAFQLLIAAFAGPQLPCLIAGAVAMIFYVFWEKWREIRCALPSWESIKARQYSLPFFVLIVWLLLYGLIPGAAYAIRGEFDPTAYSIMSPVVFSVDLPKFKPQRFDYLYHSGVIVFIIAMISPLLVPYECPEEKSPEAAVYRSLDPTGARKKNFKQGLNFQMYAKGILAKMKAEQELNLSWSQRYVHVIREAFVDAWEDVVPVIFSITAFASLAKLMDLFDMTLTIAQFIVDIFGTSSSGYAFFMPVIGMLGSALTGSTTSSNFLFGRLQVNAGRSLGLLSGKNSIWELGAGNILGASAGEIISPMNAVVVTIIDGVKNRESDLIRKLLPIFLGWLIGTMFVALIFLAPTGGFN